MDIDLLACLSHNSHSLLPNISHMIVWELNDIQSTLYANGITDIKREVIIPSCSNTDILYHHLFGLYVEIEWTLEIRKLQLEDMFLRKK